MTARASFQANPGGQADEVGREADRFACPLPAELDAAAAAPLLCAGSTVWEPLCALGVGAGSRVAVAGMGGLGHLAVRFAADIDLLPCAHVGEALHRLERDDVRDRVVLDMSDLT